MWPRSDIGSASNTNIITRDCTEQHREETTLIEAGNDSSYSTMNDESVEEPYITVSSPRRSCSYKNSNQQTEKIFSIAFPILINIPAVVLYSLRVEGNVNLLLPFNIYNNVILTIIFVFVVKCFYNMQTQCSPTSNFQSLDGNDKMWITSFLGSLAYFTMRLISNIFLLHAGEIHLVVIYKYTICIISLYFQTILILQVKNYDRARIHSSILSIEYTYVLLASHNLVTCCLGRFITSQRIFGGDVADKIGRAHV